MQTEIKRCFWCKKEITGEVKYSPTTGRAMHASCYEESMNKADKFYEGKKITNTTQLNRITEKLLENDEN